MQGESEQCDVLVVGSGSAALVAALRSAEAGLATIVVEKTDRLGGTTAMSSAGVWVPANHVARAAGIEDSLDEALAYIRAAAPCGWRETEDALWRRFVEEAPRMLSFLEERTPLRFRLTQQPDPLPDLPGAKTRGRMISPLPLRRGIIGSYAGKLRPPAFPQVFTYQEALRYDPYHHPIAAGVQLLPRLAWRWVTGARGMGSALVTGLIRGCLDLGCRFKLQTPARELLLDASGGVRGALVESSGRTLEIVADRGVVLASGGYEWNAEMLARHFPGPRGLVSSPRGNAGDGHRMAEAAGAQLAHMDQANIGPAIPTVYDGAKQGLSIAFHHEPNAILVNREGRRFVDEFRFNIGEVLDQRDPATGEPTHLPAWLISDSRMLSRAPLVRWHSRYDPDWMVRAPSLPELAAKIGLPSEALLATVKRFNELCAAGVDHDFHRKASSRALARPGAEARSHLVPIERAPFLAMPCNRSFISTKGGPRTNERAQVLRPDGSVIGGLYCAGVAMANPFGTWAVGAGTTLGPNMTWGYICGSELLTRRQETKGSA